MLETESIGYTFSYLEYNWSAELVDGDNQKPETSEEVYTYSIDTENQLGDPKENVVSIS